MITESTAPPAPDAESESDSTVGAPRALLSRRAENSILALTLALALGRLALFVRANSFSLYDDAYIYLRYADNLLRGCGPAFNCGGAMVEGFTSPLYLGLLTGISWVLGNDGQLASQVLGVACVAGTLGLVALSGRSPLLRKAVPSAPLVSLAAAMILAFEPHFLLNSVIGLDAPLAAFFVTAVFLSALHPSAPWLRTGLVLAILSRPECALLIVAAPLLPEARRLRWWLPILGAMASIQLLRLLVFHDWVPNTFWAKSGGTVQHMQLGASYIVQTFLDFPALLLIPSIALLPVARSWRLYLAAVTGVWLLFFLRSGGDLFMYGRLALPLVPVLVLAGALGVAAGLQRTWPNRRMALALPATMALGFALLSQQHTLTPGHGFPMVQRWALLGGYLAHHYPAARIATVPIGAIGYYSQLPLIDLVGLTQPEIARARRSVPPARLTREWIGHERHNTEWVLAQAPQIIVMSKFSDEPWSHLAETRAGFFSEWLLLREIKAGRTDYELCSAEVAPDLHWLLFVRGECADPTGPRGGRRTPRLADNID